MLPEILYRICQFNDMENIISFLVLSKRTYRYFTSREDFIIRKTLHALEKRIFQTENLRNFQKDNSALEQHITSLQIDKWMVEPFEIETDLSNKILKIVKERKYDQLLDGIYFITGGAITQIALEMNWPSDVDIFRACVKKEDEKREKQIINGNDCDIITKCVASPEKVLRRFDISLCQIGVLVTPNRISVYTTPLFLCSLVHKIMPIQVADITCNYLYTPNNKGNVENYFKKHILFHQGNLNEISDCGDDFLNCKNCRHIAFSNNLYVSKDSRLTRWFQRVEKYKERFPDFKISYYFARKQ
jgi:hypothetical protein